MNSIDPGRGLTEVSARDIMVRELVTVPPEMDVPTATGLLIRHGFTGAPVMDDQGRFLGVFSEKCAMRVLADTLRDDEKRGGSWGKRETRDFMASHLVTLAPETDVFDAIAFLLRHRVSGAPVVDGRRRFLGVFSEKFSMTAIIRAAYDGLPTTDVAAFMNTDLRRVISPTTTLAEVAQRFLDTSFRRLPVLAGEMIVGQVSRRDPLNCFHRCRDLIESSRRLAGALADGEAIDDAGGWRVETIMDSGARTISEDADLLAIAELFLNGPHRRLPVLRGDQLVGQVSRRDVLLAAQEFLPRPAPPPVAPLYLSSTTRYDESPLG